MATRRRIGVSAATTEAARRQLMQPVPCWEKVWVTPDSAPNGSTLKVYKWIKTDKLQQFSDDEGEADEPLAPLPDEPEIVDADEEIDQEEANATVNGDSTQPIETIDDIPSKPSSPKPKLSMSHQLSETDGGADALDASLKPSEENADSPSTKKVNSAETIELDMSGLGPDGLSLESSHNLSQMDETDGLVGGNLMNHSEDPFAAP
ncbi:hypothetical protein BDQ17DRAFT_1341299 [Cyathus striatus]|nr:hypothetical protein BDQ17DRAFT_1341299 [Cyathus striatus]